MSIETDRDSFWKMTRYLLCWHLAIAGLLW